MQCWEMVENANLFLFSIMNSAQQMLTHVTVINPTKCGQHNILFVFNMGAIHTYAE